MLSEKCYRKDAVKAIQFLVLFLHDIFCQTKPKQIKIDVIHFGSAIKHKSFALSIIPFVVLESVA
jgi:hypothetical protein